ncbi:acyltransferase family protein [Paenibacillus monticola]|uniref:Fucose 4-O-acetylase n=1 Tax=Paenibacillus monticola TaxID=2666075 RepID=A0A7X2H9C4_9BACL|nr:fucose 4-O-acetylase [Paenibacillus monticola]MRN55947.1 fucose 4-O-acetylase [Paenibacillus monticola]
MLGENSLEARGETFFLNLRFLLIVTVFTGNAIEPLIGTSSGLHSLYMWIFSFHMPLFVLVTGYFARKSMTGAAGRRMLMQIGLQYIIFQSLYSMLDASLFHVNGIHHSFFAPYLLLWFLASHAFWRLLMLGMGKWAPAGQIAFALFAGVLVGYLQLDGVWFSISRTFIYLPYFVIGYHFSFPALVRIYQQWTKIAAATVSILLFIILMIWGTNLPLGWLYGSMTYMQLGHQEWYAGLYRLGIYGLQLAASLAFLGWVPYGVSRMTDWGRRTLYVFLLHGFVVRLAAISGLYAYIGNSVGAILLLLASISLTVLLAQPTVKRLLHPLVEPSVSWMVTLQRAALRRSL